MSLSWEGGAFPFTSALLPALTLQLRPLPARGRSLNPLASAVVTRVIGTMSLSDSRHDRTCPSRAFRWWRHTPPSGRVSRVAFVLLAGMPSSLPRWTRAVGLFAWLTPLDRHGGGLPPYTAGSASTSFVSRPCDVHVVTACLLAEPPEAAL
jgi:hypothetical protein